MAYIGQAPTTLFRRAPIKDSITDSPLNQKSGFEGSSPNGFSNSLYFNDPPDSNKVIYFLSNPSEFSSYRAYNELTTQSPKA